MLDRFVLTVAAATGALADDKIYLPEPRWDHSYRRPHTRCTGKRYRANGARERARRIAQIAAGRLRAANGLVENKVALAA